VSGDESKRPKPAPAERIIPDHHYWAQPDTQTTVSGGRRCAFPPYACLVMFAEAASPVGRLVGFMLTPILRFAQPTLWGQGEYSPEDALERVCDIVQISRLRMFRKV
jgi:hypothetical protein